MPGVHREAQGCAQRRGVTFLEVSPRCNFNVTESSTELARIVLRRHGMDRLWRPNKVLSLQDLCYRAIVSCTLCILLRSSLSLLPQEAISNLSPWQMALMPG